MNGSGHGHPDLVAGPEEVRIPAHARLARIMGSRLSGALPVLWSGRSLRRE
jgi:hypothetical protein